MHTGLRASYAPSPGLALSLFCVNGWNANFVDGNGLRAFAGAASWEPREGLELVVVYMGGLERPAFLPGDTRLSYRNLLSTYVSYAAAKSASFAFATDYGNDRAAGGVQWWGAAAYARFQPTPWLALAARGELVTDPEGFATGTRQQVAEGTGTVDLLEEKGRGRFIERLEFRHDASSARVFDGASAATRKGQDTLTAALLVAF